MAHDMSNMELRYVKIEPAENGYTVMCDYKMTGNSKKMNYDYDYSHDQFVFENVKGVLDFVKKKLS